MKAFEVLLPGEPEWKVGICNAETAGKARYRAFLSAREANYYYPLTAFRVRRRPELDEWAKLEKRSGLFCREYVESKMANQ